MSKPVRISHASPDNCGIVAFLYERAADGSDTLVGTWPLSSMADVAELTVTATRYVVVRASDDDAAKTIDNW